MINRAQGAAQLNIGKFDVEQYLIPVPDISKIKVGNYSYGRLNVHNATSTDVKLEIGHFCSIGPDVIFLLGVEHNYKYVSTFPWHRRCYQDNILDAEYEKKEPQQIEIIQPEEKNPLRDFD